jgi:multidrug transporter EmrE-like cation transporter
MSYFTMRGKVKYLFYAALLASILLGIAGQLLMKFAMSTTTDYLFTRQWLIQLVLGLTIYSLGVVNWVLAVSYVKLSIAYPLTSLNYVGILLGSYYFFGEQISFTRSLGILLIFIGVMLVAIPVRQTK